MLIKNNNPIGCNYLETAAKKNYTDIESELTGINVFRQLCQG